MTQAQSTPDPVPSSQLALTWSVRSDPYDGGRQTRRRHVLPVETGGLCWSRDRYTESVTTTLDNSDRLEPNLNRETAPLPAVRLRRGRSRWTDPMRTYGAPLPFLGPRRGAILEASELYIVKTTRNCALPLIMRAQASAAFSIGQVSIIGRTPVSSAKRSVSSESAGVRPSLELFGFRM